MELDGDAVVLDKETVVLDEDTVVLDEATVVLDEATVVLEADAGTDDVGVDVAGADVGLSTGVGTRVCSGLGSGMPPGYESTKMSFWAPSRKL